MHVSSFTPPLSLDPNSNNQNPVNNLNNYSYKFLPNINLNWLVQFFITALILGLGFIHLLRSTASKYFSPNFDSPRNSSSAMSAVSSAVKSCAVCGKISKTRCAGCKAIYYCSPTCQSKHWNSEHKKICSSVLQSSAKSKSQQAVGGRRKTSICLVPLSGSDKIQLVDKVLFPYDEFVKFFNWDKKPFSPPRGLLNCGNSCFANVVLQCLAHTRPLVAYLLEKGHRRYCRRDGWCFLCLLEEHMDRACGSEQPFSPINILSRLPSMGGNLHHGKQEDAHEFMRFAIDMMQSVCLDEHGGEKVIHPKSQETTLIQHIYGGYLQSQVKCTGCSQVSNQYENMMDLTVEIQGDATSLQECLDQFTSKELLDGENMYKCDRCKDYVMASKRLTIFQAPNILTIALKRFESGIFGKINKKITFPERLDLSPYMSDERDGTDKYELYAVVVHVDMLNASFFGHYICYTKSFQGDWYKIDDCKVARVELDEVLSQGAYMLLYKRVSARPNCLKTFEAASKEQVGNKVSIVVEDSCLNQKASSLNSFDPSSSMCSSADQATDVNEQLDTVHIPLHPLHSVDLGPTDLRSEDSDTVNPVSCQPASTSSVANSVSIKNQLEHAQAPMEHISGLDNEPVCDVPEDSQTINHVSALPVSVEVIMNGNDAANVDAAPIGADISKVSGSSVDAYGDTLCKGSDTASISDEMADGIPDRRSEVEPVVVNMTQDSAAALVDQTASDEVSWSSNSNSNGCVTDSLLESQRYKKYKSDEYSPNPNPGKGKIQAFADDTKEVTSVELNDSSSFPNGNGEVDSMITDESPLDNISTEKQTQE